MKRKTLNTKSVLNTVIIIVAFVSATYAASLPKINVNSQGIAIKGYDTVAYFTMGKPVRGDERFSYRYNGARWLFSSEEHLNLFKNAPEKYMPQYGGY
jgi:YHS domain-containing protein